MAYRRSRNLEASLIDYLSTALTMDGWTGIRCVKSLAQVYDGEVPAILIYVQDTDTQKREVGGNLYLKFPTVYIRIFADNDGQRLDLADWILEKLEVASLPYYQYTITNGVVSSKVLKGNIVIRSINRNEKELANTQPDTLDEEDRYRHLIELSCFIGEN
jgi:hypothetical protein